MTTATAMDTSKPLRKACRFQFDDGKKGWTVKESRKTILCVARRFGAPASYVDAIAYRESRWYHRAVNPRSGTKGLYQFMPTTWTSMRRMFPYIAAVSSSHPLNARSNALIAIRFMSTNGYGPWAGTA